MKTSFYLTTCCLIALGLFLLWGKLAVNNNDTSVVINENGNMYEFLASYPTGETGKVQDYINSNVRPNGLFRSENDYFNVTTVLTDRTEFNVKEAPGKLRIELDKQKNSTASISRIKNMCTGIKALLKTK